MSDHDDSSDPSKTLRGPEEEIQPSLASDPPAGVTGPTSRRTGLHAALGWMLLGVVAIVAIVLALRALEPPGPGAAPQAPDVIVQPQSPTPKAPPADIAPQG